MANAEIFLLHPRILLHSFPSKYYEISLKLYYKKHYFATINRILCNDIHTTIIFFDGGRAMIDVLEQILYYRKQKGWTEYQLAEKSGLTQSTISSWYRKNMIPSIPSLEKVCNAFGITLSQFFSENEDNFALTPNQKELLLEAGHLSEKQQAALIAFFRTL